MRLLVPVSLLLALACAGPGQDSASASASDGTGGLESTTVSCEGGVARLEAETWGEVERVTVTPWDGDESLGAIALDARSTFIWYAEQSTDCGWATTLTFIFASTAVNGDLDEASFHF